MTGWQRRLVFILVAANVAVHYGDVPAWIPSLALLFVGWRWLADIYRIPCPGRWGAAIFAAAATFGVWAEFARLIGDPASTALLVIMVALKTFEIRGYRDLMIVTYLCLLLLMAKLLSSQTLLITAFMFVDVISVLALMHLYHLPYFKGGLPWRRAGRLLLQATPVFVALFFLFPRFNFSLFQRQAEQINTVGFSGQVRPGSVAQLAQSDQVAFRAFFRSGIQPPVSRLYWRGAVLEKVVGLNWDPVIPIHRKVRRQPPSDNTVEIMIESGNSPWLFTLDWPLNVEMGSGYRQEQVEESSGRSFSLRSPLLPRETYAVNFQTSTRAVPWDPNEALGALEVGDPGRRVRELINSWKAVRSQPTEALRVIQDYFVQQKFGYTLTPPETEDVDEFLFQTKTGFCEHYAGSVATLLRLLDIPARVIVGYHGGSPSLMGDYLLIYQRDAHAWVEYWDAKKGSWQRIDPTTWVASDQAVAMLGQGFGAWQNNPLAKWLGPDFMSTLVRSRLIVDQAEIMWITFMLRYDFKYQQELFNRWGLGNITRGLLFILSAFAVIILGFLFYALLRFNNRRRTDPEVELYRKLCKQLDKAGLDRLPNEGPLNYLKRAQQKFPQQADLLAQLFGGWMALRYGTMPFSEKAGGEWRQLLRKLAAQMDAGVRQD